MNTSCHVFIYKPNINYCPKSAYVILVVIVVVVIMVVFVFVSVFNNKTNVSKYAYVILEQLLNPKKYHLSSGLSAKLAEYAAPASW